jgi:hypothetical protein
MKNLDNQQKTELLILFLTITLLIILIYKAYTI